MNEQKIKSIQRFFASAIDFLFLLAITIILTIPSIVSLINILVFGNNLNSVALFLSSFASGALAILHVVFYLIFLPVAWNGQTLGKRFFKIKIVKNDGTAVDFKGMFIRVVSYLITFVFSLGLSMIVEIINVAASKNHTSIFDIVASTKVVPVVEEGGNDGN